MKFQVRARRVCPGSYELAYGRGSKKLMTGAIHTDDGWVLQAGDVPAHMHQSVARFDTFKEVKDRWGGWAEEAYEQAAEEGPRPPPEDDNSTQPADYPFPEEITDYDLLALDRLVGRYGEDHLIAWIKGYDPARMKTALDKGLKFRLAVFRHNNSQEITP